MKTQSPIFITLIFTGILLLAGCSKKESELCEFVICDYGTCTDGKCKCPTGYEGSKCLTEVRTKYLGTFTSSEQCSVSYDGTYSITISTIPSEITKVNFYGIWGTSENTTGVVKDDGNIYILSQPFYSGSTITGKAMLINGKLKVSYTVTGASQLNGQTDNCVWQQQ